MQLIDLPAAQVTETSSVPLQSRVLELFRCCKKARQLALEAASTAYHAAREREDALWEVGEEMEGPCLSFGEHFLQLKDERSTTRWQVAVKVLK